MTPELSELLDRLESDQLDFKATGYRWSEEESRHAFVKDIVCMASCLALRSTRMMLTSKGSLRTASTRSRLSATKLCTSLENNSESL